MKNMYKIDGKYKYACQMCHDAFANVEMCQIANEPGLELDAMNLCLCPNCAREYKKMRADSDEVEWFLNSIAELNDSEINEADPVEIDFDGELIWFTQSHIAEIRELMALQEAVDDYKDNNEKTVAKMQEKLNDDLEAEVVVAGTDVYKDYIGKRVFHTKQRMYGIVRTCDDKYLGIEFESGPRKGQVTKYSLEMCLRNGLIEII